MNKPFSETKAVFFGDSITHAICDGNTCFGWPGRVGKALQLAESCNAGFSGASVSTIRGENRILKQVTEAGADYDLVLLHGGVNDAWDKAPIGAMLPVPAEETDLGALDTTTFAGGLEELLIKTKEKYPHAKIGYIINFRCRTQIGVIATMDDYIEQLIAICNKWDIPYLDLFHDEELSAKLNLSVLGENAHDGIHPTPAGYDILAPYITEFVASLPAE